MLTLELASRLEHCGASSASWGRWRGATPWTLITGLRAPPRTRGRRDHNLARSTCDHPVPDRVQRTVEGPYPRVGAVGSTPSSQILRLTRTEARRNWTPDWTPCPDATKRQNAAFSRAFLRSGRQDLNLRPPGPQPERSRRTRCDSPLYGGLSCCELCSVALNLHPRLHPADSPWRDAGRPPPLTSAALLNDARAERLRSRVGHSRLLPSERESGGRGTPAACQTSSGPSAGERLGVGRSGDCASLSGSRIVRSRDGSEPSSCSAVAFRLPEARRRPGAP